MNKLTNLRKRGVEIADAPPAPEDIVLLTQIRDALLANGGALPAQRHAASDDPALDTEGWHQAELSRLKQSLTAGRHHD